MDVIIQKIHQLTPTIRAFELVAANGTELPSFEAGAHIDVHLKNGLTRQYSLSNCCSEKHRYVIGVLQPYLQLDRFGLGVPKVRFRNDALSAPYGLNSP